MFLCSIQAQQPTLTAPLGPTTTETRGTSAHHPPPSRSAAFLFTGGQAPPSTALVRGRGRSTVSWSATTRALSFLTLQSLLL